jgi:tetratricopeptide (TPR) repeat protein
MLASGSYDRAREMYSAAINDMRGRRVQLALTSSERLFGVFGPTSLLDQFPDGRYAGVFPDRTDFFLELQRESKTGFELGLLLIEMGKPQEAIKAFKEALEAYPRNPWLPIMRYYAKFIPGAKLPEIPDLAFEADELKVKFDLPPEPPKTPAAGAKDAKPGAAPKGAAEAGKALPTGAAPKGAGPAKQ